MLPFQIHGVHEPIIGFLVGPEQAALVINRLPFVNEPGFQRTISISIGQNIYTPENIIQSDLIQYDRPYAGITYFAIGFHSKNNCRMDTLEFDLGIVCRYSYAEDCQKVIHEWINSTAPKDWYNQLKDEPVLNIFYGRKWKLVQSGIGRGFSYDLIPCIGVGLGNVLTYAHAGTGLRFCVEPAERLRHFYYPAWFRYKRST
ncbi:MAG: lipid A deacylase LpxR family protein [Deltaproteobacteria bacterium]|nr:lipid A deacylase LpxR family protein [Deltaproteobacteria bacterium]